MMIYVYFLLIGFGVVGCSYYIDSNRNYPPRVGFHVGLTRHRSLHPSDTIIFDKIITNIADAYNNETGHFTAPHGGMYTFTATFLSNSDRLGVMMFRNEESISAAYADNGGSCTTTAVVILNEGDVVQIRYWALGVIGRIEAELCYFSGYFIN